VARVEKEAQGTIVEALPGQLYRVELSDGRRLLAHIGQQLRLTYVRVLPGDRVVVELSPYDRSRGRIVARSAP
jgi:translation initiation factor IF-1